MSSDSENLYVILGCFGRRDDNFISCTGIENRILKLDLSIQGYDDILDYFDGCRLFDRPMFDLNAVRNFIFHMQDKYDQGLKRLWSEKEFTLFQKFIIDHRICGTYIKLILVSSKQDIIPEEEPQKIFIRGIKAPTILPRIRRIK